jgi:hypothetical protein
MPNQSRYTWDLNRLQFRDARTGRYVSPDHVFRQVNRVISLSERRMMALAEQVRTREISVAQFKNAMRAEVKSLHLATAIAGNGGLSQMTPARWGKVGGRLKSEFQFLNRFGSNIGSRDLPRESARIRSRARAYSANARLEYWETVNARLQESGMIVEASRKLGPVATEHCAGCQSVASIWKPLDALPPIGTMECRWFCACSIQYRIRRGPPLTGDQEVRLTQRVDFAPRENPVLSTNLNVAERDFLERNQERFGRDKIDGRVVYFGRNAPPGVAAPLSPALPQPLTALTNRELQVFQRIAVANSSVSIAELNAYEAQLARRLWKRGELTRLRIGANYFYRRSVLPPST